ncbi:phosphodiester glycosidase family protein [Streptomyces buecherae]|uniref:phosphodiester glycosidase family protein n=1 Tax=Streptomyces buecherae TaxID=2763006 RepID=UPI001C263C22|nr:phosphodiester glycosidase family protein [Streptomyces buecherae]
MRTRLSGGRATLGVVVAWLALLGGGLVSAPVADAADAGPRFTQRATIAPGVEYREFSVDSSHGTAYGHLLSIDLRTPGLSLDLVHPGAVGARAPLSQLAGRRGAVAAVNGDFFNINESQHPGVEATGAPVGPAIAAGHRLKGAVPLGQRFGPKLPPGTGTEDVIAVGRNRTARLDRLSLRGTVRTPHGSLALRGLNQYALAENGIGAFTAAWGQTSRVRATCGTDTDRGAPCSGETYEVTVRKGRVSQVAETPGGGPVAADSVVLVGREAGAASLRGLRVGDRVSVRHALTASRPGPLAFAVGGYPIARGQQPLAGLDDATPAVRSAAGIGAGGHRVYLLSLDGRPEYRAGLTIAELAELMLALGADDAVNLDGGGSATMVTREPGTPGPAVRNNPSGGVERAIPNGIGVFTAI